ncbi:conserved exported hypothetical protein [uncultured delta proteobacterium]|uniref:Lipoprotein n=1 Tax=uncultured delta proteobacterium TaxID=34034 RepID=A0A212K8P4_9DELT|nr:conserved exported hypothetical protein [uncultured delta proteobacterium]
MRILFAAIMLLTVFATPCFAGSCQDTQEAVSAAILERSGRVSDSHNVLLPDPESERGPLSNCLSVINHIGDGFTLGVNLPSMDQIITGLCNQVDSMIQQKINEAHNQVLSTVNQLGGNNLYKVYGTGGNYVIKIKDKIK